MRAVTIEFEALSNWCKDGSNGDVLHKQVEEAFGQGGLGLMQVAGVPGYPEKRMWLLPIARKLAALSENVKYKFERPSLQFQFGWSHGRELLEDGRPDVGKGSFYANPFDDDGENELLSAKNNIWPKDELPELEVAFRELSETMKLVAKMLARLCDEFLKTKGVRVELAKMIETSKSAKGRLLHYFPGNKETDEDDGKWCGWHVDHGSITCLTKAIYFDEVENKDVTGEVEDKLAIEARNGFVHHVQIREDCIAFQIGQAAQIVSGAFLVATPHCVMKTSNARLSRSTFALFLQPNHDTKLNPPATHGGQLPENLKPGMTFSDFTKATVDSLYKSKL